jgi:hypothetical protein
VPSHYLDKPTYPTVLDYYRYYRARMLDETTRRRCQDRNGTVVRAWHLAIALLPRWLRAPKGGQVPYAPYSHNDEERMDRPP